MTVATPVRAAAVALLGVVLAAAPAAAVPRPRPAVVSDPVTLLQRAVAAGASLPYAGVQYVSTWHEHGASSVVANVVHVPGRGSEVRVAQTPDGPGTAVFDSDHDVDGSLVSLEGSTLDMLLTTYTVRTAGTDEVVGRPADLVEAVRPDGSVAGRLWLDHATGLLLRREVYDTAGQLVQASSFVSLQIGPGAEPTSMPAPATRVPAPWGREVAVADAASLRAQGWRVSASLGGLRLFDIRLGTAGGATVLHLTYSDGLSSLSLFEQRGRLAASHLGGWNHTTLASTSVWVNDAMPEQVVWSGPRMVYTVLGDASPSMLGNVVAALPHAPHTGGLWARIKRGFARIVSWLNPFN